MPQRELELGSFRALQAALVERPRSAILPRSMTFWGFWLGLLESFLHGAFLGLVFVPVYNLPGHRTLPGPRDPISRR